MTPQNAVAPTTAEAEPVLGAQAQVVTIETRFGEIVFDRANAIYMPRGLLGYADFRDFGLADMPDARLGQFRLLQSFTEPSLSFVVAPLDTDAGLVEAQDVRDACRVLSVGFEEIAVLLIVATRRIGETTQISVNLRAPILVDTGTQTAWQYVLGNSRYPVRYVIADANKAAG